MKNLDSQLLVQVSLRSWWHCSSGTLGTGDLDAAVLRDRDGLPYLPGKTLKGLFRDAAGLVWCVAPPAKGDSLESWFGEEGGSDPGALQFTNAGLSPEVLAGYRLLPPGTRGGLYDRLAQTALKDGVARDNSLRNTEVVIPVDLQAEVAWQAGPPPKDLQTVLNHCAALIRRLGLHRHRGLGKCVVTVKNLTPETP
jgi:hypothetical protein